MSQHRDTKEEVLEEMLSKFQESYRKKCPSGVLLFAERGDSFTPQDVAKEISSMNPHEGRAYVAYIHRFLTGNVEIGLLRAVLEKEELKVTYSDIRNPQRYLRFRMETTSDRVVNYTLEGKDGQDWPSFKNELILGAIESFSTKSQF